MLANAFDSTEPKPCVRRYKDVLNGAGWNHIQSLPMRNLGQVSPQHHSTFGRMLVPTKPCGIRCVLITLPYALCANTGTRRKKPRSTPR